MGKKMNPVIEVSKCFLKIAWENRSKQHRVVSNNDLKSKLQQSEVISNYIKNNSLDLNSFYWNMRDFWQSNNVLDSVSGSRCPGGSIYFYDHIDQVIIDQCLAS
jgi:hypothetical protein